MANLEQFRHAASDYQTAVMKQRAVGRMRIKEQDAVSRASIQELHAGIGSYFESLWKTFGSAEGGSTPVVTVSLNRPTVERVAPAVVTFLRTTMGVDKTSPLSVVVVSGMGTHGMDLSIGNIGVRIQTSDAWLSHRARADVSVFDVPGRLEKEKEKTARNKLVKAFDGGAKDKFDIAHQLFTFVVDQTTEHLTREAKRIMAETK